MSVASVERAAGPWWVLVVREGTVIAEWAVTGPGEATALAAVAAEFWPGLVCRVVRPGGQTGPRTGMPDETSLPDHSGRTGPRPSGPDQTGPRTTARTDRVVSASAAQTATATADRAADRMEVA